MKRTTLFLVTFTLLAALTCFVPPPLAHAGGQVTNCSNDTDFSNKLSGGGTVTFDCGTATIPFSSTKGILSDTVIDGGGTITLSGENTYRLFLVYNGFTLTLKNITLINGKNSTTAGGGVTNNGSLVLDHVTMHGMDATDYSGGAISTRGALNISKSSLYDNQAKWGGAITASGVNALVNISDTSLYENKATGTTPNVDGFGGAIYGYNGATISITASTIYSNSAESGGGIYMETPSTLYVETSQISTNGASSAGGGIWNRGSTSVSESTLTGNRTEAVSTGGGIANYGELTMRQSTLDHNQSYAGGALNNYYGSADLTNVTLSGNTATAYGGGINNWKGTVNLTNVTLDGNSHGILNQTNADTHLNLKNVIIADSKTGSNCDFSKAPDTSDHNLSSDNTCNFGTGRNNVNAMLNPLAKNGGSTQTHLPKYGSPAIDNGTDDGAPSVDQRGVLRPQGTFYDVGAVEVELCTAKPTGLKLKKPENNAPLTNPRPTLRWTKATCAKTYTVFIKNAATGKLADKKAGLTVLKYQPDDPLPKGATYKWFVKACNPDAPADQRCNKSKTRQFTLQ